MGGIDGECIDRAQRRSSEMCVKFIWPAEYQVALVSTADKKRVCSQRDATVLMRSQRATCACSSLSNPFIVSGKEKLSLRFFSRLLVFVMYLAFAQRGRYIFPFPTFPCL